MDFSQLKVIVSGASRGLGKTVANILHEYGATVIALFNNTPIKDEVYTTIKCDITNEKDIKNMFKIVLDKYENFNVLINCAAISMDEDIYNKTKEDFMKVLEVNLVGTFLLCKEASLHMDRGVIINVSSTNASTTFNPISIDYDASKAGVENLTKNLALRLPNIKVCALAPNWIDTESVLEMDENYLKGELKRVNQKELLKKEEVALKIIEMIVNDDYISGNIYRIGVENE